MPHQTIEEIIARLERIIDDALRGQRRIGYFAGLYERVTSNVRRALVAGDVFRDNPRMERLDVIFAEQLVAAGAGNREHLIAKRDAETAIVGQTLYPLHGFAAHVARWIHSSECKDIRTNIQIIAE